MNTASGRRGPKVFHSERSRLLNKATAKVPAVFEKHGQDEHHRRLSRASDGRAVRAGSPDDFLPFALVNVTGGVAWGGVFLLIVLVR